MIDSITWIKYKTGSILDLIIFSTLFHIILLSIQNRYKLVENQIENIPILMEITKFLFTFHVRFEGSYESFISNIFNLMQ